jgi:hypothetical protein
LPRIFQKRRLILAGSETIRVIDFDASAKAFPDSVFFKTEGLIS